MRAAENWKDYELIDCSDGERLERWGDIILVRPDPQVIWNTPKEHPGWRKYDARYLRSNTGGGHWSDHKLPERWQIKYKDYLTFTADMTKALRGDSAPMPMTTAHRGQIVALEFCFTAKSGAPVNVCLKNIRFTDRNLSKKRVLVKKKVAARSDTQLPTN